MSTEFHKKWTGKYRSLHKMCLLSPPDLPKGVLTPEKITAYNRSFAPFYKFWGSKWLWVPALPLLVMCVVLQRMFMTFRVWKDIGLLRAHYAQVVPPWLSVLSFPAAAAHLLLRVLFLPKDILLDIWRLLGHEAVWRGRTYKPPLPKYHGRDRFLFIFCGGPLVLRAGIIQFVRSTLSLRWFKRWRDYRAKYLDGARYTWEGSRASSLKVKSLKPASMPAQLTVEHIDNYCATAEDFWWTLYKQTQQKQTHCQIFDDGCSLYHFYRDLRNNAHVIQSQRVFRVYPALKNEFVRHLGGFAVVTNYRLFVRVQFQGWIPIALCDLKTYHLDAGPFIVEWIQNGESRSLSLTGEGLTPSSVHSARSKTKSSWDSNQKMLLYTACSDIPVFHEVRHFGWVSSYRLEESDVDFTQVPTMTFPKQYSKEEEQTMALSLHTAISFLAALHLTVQFLAEQGDGLAVSLFSGMFIVGIAWFLCFIVGYGFMPFTMIAFLSPENRDPNSAGMAVKLIELILLLAEAGLWLGLFSMILSGFSMMFDVLL